MRTSWDVPALDAASKGDRTQRVFSRADKSTACMDTMNVLRSAGYLTVALVGLEADR
jgi:biopolymer transport protein ExbD